VQEVIVINQARIIRAPQILDALLENPALTPDTRRRALETREEFFDKKARDRAGACGGARTAGAGRCSARRRSPISWSAADGRPDDAAAVAGSALSLEEVVEDEEGQTVSGRG
jgi:hypothetical protein